METIYGVGPDSNYYVSVSVADAKKTILPEDISYTVTVDNSNPKFIRCANASETKVEHSKTDDFRIKLDITRPLNVGVNVYTLFYKEKQLVAVSQNGITHINKSTNSTSYASGPHSYDENGNNLKLDYDSYSVVYYSYNCIE